MTAGADILVLGTGLAPEAQALARDEGVTIESLAPYPDEVTLVAAIERVRPTVIVVRTGQVTAAAIKAGLPTLRLIAKHGVGTDTIDVATATALGVPVSITTGVNALSVAEHALTLALAAARSVVTLDRRMREGHWDKPTVSGTELSGKTLGLIGYGAIARHLADLTAPFRMPVLVHDPYSHTDLGTGRIRRAESLDELLRLSDVLSLHCPLTAETRNMIGPDQLAAMKRGAILVNTARGGLVDEDALAKALATGHLGGAGLDTFSHEPPASGGALFDAPNLIVTPHIGASTDEAKTRVGTTVIRQAIDAMRGQLPDDWMLANPGVRAAA